MYLSSRLTWPPLGGENKSWQELALLSHDYEITWIGLADPSSEAVARLSKIVSRVIAVKDPLWLKALRCLRTFWNGKALQVEYFNSAKARAVVREEALKHDLVLCNLLRTAEWARGLSIPKFLDMSDSIATHYRNALGEITSPLWRAIYTFEAPRMDDAEKAAVREFRATFMFNPVEIADLQFEGRVTWIPHGVNQSVLEHSRSEPMNSKRLCFLGKMDYRPNIEAAKWFVSRVMPLLPPEFEFWIIGAKPTPEVKAFASARVRVTGFVDDPYAVMKGSLCSVVPVFTGAGIQNKLLEAMGLGTVCVVSPMAAQALVGAVDGREFLIAASPEDFAAKIRSLNASSESFVRMKLSAREYISDKYTWPTTVAAMTSSFKVRS